MSKPLSWLAIAVSLLSIATCWAADAAGDPLLEGVFNAAVGMAALGSVLGLVAVARSQHRRRWIPGVGAVAVLAGISLAVADLGFSPPDGVSNIMAIVASACIALGLPLQIVGMTLIVREAT